MARDDLTFALREAVLSLRLGGSVHLLSVLSIALTLLLVGGFVSARRGLEHLIGLVRGQAEVTAYLRDGVAEAEVRAAEAALRRLPGVRSVRRVTREQALEEMKQVLGPGAQVLAELGGRNPFAAYLAVGVEPEAAGRVYDAAARLRAVEHVQDSRRVLERLAALSRAASRAGAGLAVAAGVVAAVVIAHVVHLSIHARREEIETLRLMGASGFFVALPFLLEGVIAGGAGGLLAALGLAALLPGLDGTLGRALPFLPRPPWGALWQEAAGVALALGLACGALGSAAALGRITTLHPRRRGNLVSDTNVDSA